MTRKEMVAYAAGIIDGEGCIAIYRDNCGTTFRVRVSCVMGQPQATRLLHGLFGGTWWDRCQKRYYQHRDRYCWSIFSADAAKMLKEIRPYLRLKGEQADLVIRFTNHVIAWQRWRHRNVGGKNTKGGPTLPAHVMKRREAWFEQLKAMHSGKGRRRARVETNPEGPAVLPLVSDSPDSVDGKHGEGTSKDFPASLH